MKKKNTANRDRKLPDGIGQLLWLSIYSVDMKASTIRLERALIFKVARPSKNGGNGIDTPDTLVHRGKATLKILPTMV